MIRDQSNKMTLLEQKGNQTLQSVEGFDKRLALLENSHVVKGRTHFPPEI